MYQSEQINELAFALSKAQSEITPAIKDSVNPFFKSKYADLSNVWDACRTPLTKNGLTVIQTMDYKEDKIFLVTTLAHSSGQWIKSILPIIPNKQDAQGIGSAITYMRRYSLAALVGVTTDEDDDGNAASMNVAKKEPLVTKISKAQSTELQDMLYSCDPIYQTQFWSFLKKELPNVEALDQLPSQMYLRIKSAIEKKSKESSKEAAYA